VRALQRSKAGSGAASGQGLQASERTGCNGPRSGSHRERPLAHTARRRSRSVFSPGAVSTVLVSPPASLVCHRRGWPTDLVAHAVALALLLLLNAAVERFVKRLVRRDPALLLPARLGRQRASLLTWWHRPAGRQEARCFGGRRRREGVPHGRKHARRLCPAPGRSQSTLTSLVSPGPPPCPWSVRKREQRTPCVASFRRGLFLH
jgi:hypothetical protein